MCPDRKPIKLGRHINGMLGVAKPSLIKYLWCNVEKYLSNIVLLEATNTYKLYLVYDLLR